MSPRPNQRIGIDYRAATSAPYSGIGRQIRALSDALARLPENEVILFSDGVEEDCPPNLVQPSPPSHKNQTHRPHHRLWYEHRFLPQALAEHAIDIFISTANCGVPAPLRTQIHRVLFIHDFFPFTIDDLYLSLRQRLLYGSYFQLSGRLGLRLADEIITPSSFNIDECRHLFPEQVNKMQLLPNLVPGFPNLAGERIAASLPERYWLVVGTTGPRKNIAGFLDAWANGGPTLPPVVMVGNPADFSPEQRARHGDRLIVLADVNDGELGYLYRHADRLWHPSHAEGFGLTPVEAMSVGTPVAVARGTALDEIVPPGTPRFTSTDSAEMQQLMRDLAAAPRNPEPDPALLAWADRFGIKAYQERVALLSQRWRDR